MEHIIILNSRKSCIMVISILGFKKILADSFLFDGAQYETNLEAVLVIRYIQHQEKQNILPTIRCKNNKSLPQSGMMKQNIH